MGLQIESARAVEPGLPVALAHVRELDLAAGRRGVDEALVAHVDADVGIRPAQRIEKHQVTRPQQTVLHGQADGAECLSVARQGKPAP